METDAPDRRAFWGGPAETALFAAVCVAQAIPVLAFPWFVNWDGPSHVGTAFVLDHWHDADAGVFREYLRIDAVPMPNLTGYLVLVGLLQVMSPAWAEKVLVAALVVAFPVAVRYLLRAAPGDALAASYLAIPLAAGWFVHGGQYNFVLGLTLGVALVGRWLRTPPRGWRGVGLLAAALVAVYLTHLVALAITLTFLWGLAAWRWWAGGRSGDLRRVAAAGVPALALALWWLTSSGAGDTGRLPPSELVKSLAALKGAIAVFSPTEIVVGAALVITTAVTGIVLLLRRRPLSPRDPALGSLAVAAAGTVLYLALPDTGGGGGYLSARLSLVPFLAALLWIAHNRVPSRGQAAMAALAIGSVLALTLIRIPYYRAFTRDFREYLSVGDHIAPGSTVLPLVYVDNMTSPPGTARGRYVQPMQELSSWLISRIEVVDLAQYEAGFEYFPVQFRPERDPFRTIGDRIFVGVIPPDVHFLDYPARTGGTVDYVYTWGRAQAPESVRASREWTDVERQLAAAYELVYSTPRGLWELYRRTG